MYRVRCRILGTWLLASTALLLVSSWEVEAGQQTYSTTCDLTLEFSNNTIDRDMTPDELVYIDATWARSYNAEASNLQEDRSMQLLDVVFYEQAEDGEVPARRNRQLGRRAARRTRRRVVGYSLAVCTGRFCASESKSLTHDYVGDRVRRALRHRANSHPVPVEVPNHKTDRGLDMRSQQRRNLVVLHQFFGDFCNALPDYGSDLLSEVVMCSVDCADSDPLTVTQWVKLHYEKDDQKEAKKELNNEVKMYFREYHGESECWQEKGVICSKCQGDCDYDRDCEGNLICFERNANQAVPGCVYSAADDVTGKDYCIDPQDLIVGQASEAQVEEQSDTIQVHTTTTTTNPAPTEKNTKCDSKKGDCDDPETPVPAPAAPILVPSAPVTIVSAPNPAPAPSGKLPFLTTKCSKNDQCSTCEGDCSDNNECVGSLLCFEEDKMPVPGCEGNREDRKGYCFDASFLFQKHENYACRADRNAPGKGGPENTPNGPKDYEAPKTNKDYYSEKNVKSMEECKVECIASEDCVGFSYSEYYEQRCELWTAPIDHLEPDQYFSCHKLVKNDSSGRLLESQKEEAQTVQGSLHVAPKHLHFKGLKDHGCRFDKANPNLGGPLDEETSQNPNKYFTQVAASSLQDCQQKCLEWEECVGVEYDDYYQDVCDLWKVPIGHMEKVMGLECFVKTKSKLPPTLQYGRQWDDDDDDQERTLNERWMGGDHWTSTNALTNIPLIIEGHRIGKFGGILDESQVYDEAINEDPTSSLIITTFEYNNP